MDGPKLSDAEKGDLEAEHDYCGTEAWTDVLDAAAIRKALTWAAQIAEGTVTGDVAAERIYSWMIDNNIEPWEEPAPDSHVGCCYHVGQDVMPMINCCR